MPEDHRQFKLIQKKVYSLFYVTVVWWIYIKKKSSFISYHNSAVNCIYSYIKEKEMQQLSELLEVILLWKTLLQGIVFPR
jgi:hypothetical protein